MPLTTNQKRMIADMIKKLVSQVNNNQLSHGRFSAAIQGLKSNFPPSDVDSIVGANPEAMAILSGSIPGVPSKGIQRRGCCGG